jgi:hypothetical protein
MDRSLLDEAFEGRWPFGGGQIPMVCYGGFDAGTLPSVGSVVTSPVGAEQEDVGAIDSGVLAELPERLDDGPVDVVGGEIDEMRRDAGDEGFERDARLQRARALGKRPRIGPQPKEQISQIPQQQNRREVEQESGSPGASLDAGVIVEISALQRPRQLRRGPFRTRPRTLSTSGSVFRMSRPCATSVSASAASRVAGGRTSPFNAAVASAAIFSSGLRMNWSIAFTRAPISVTTVSSLPRSRLACVKYASEFCSSALSDLKVSTRASCLAASATSSRRRRSTSALLPP